MTITIAVLLAMAVFQFVVGSLAYVRDTLKGASQPNRMTFLIWAVGPFIGVLAGLSAGGSWALLPVFMAGLGPFCILVASFVNPKAYWRLGAFDYLCGALALLSLVLWAVTSDPIVAILFAAAADFLALFPTLIKAWKFPHTETGQTYLVALLGALAGVAVSQHTASEMIFLAVLVVEDAALVVAVYRGRFLRSI